MKSIYFGLVSLSIVFATCQAYMTPRHSPYQSSPYNYYGNYRRQRTGHFYDQDQDQSETLLQKRQSGSWGPYNRQTYWSNPSLERPIERTFQGAPNFNNPFAGGADGFVGSQTSESEEGGGILEAAMPALVGGVFAVALSSIFHNSLMVNATTNETFPQLFAFPQLIDPYNPPRIVRRDAEGNEIEVEADDDQQLLLQLISESPCARAKLSCLIGQRIVYFTKEQGLLEAFLNPDVPGLADPAATMATETPNGNGNSILEDFSPPDSASGEIVPMKYQKELQDFLVRIKESDCVHIQCED